MTGAPAHTGNGRPPPGTDDRLRRAGAGGARRGGTASGARGRGCGYVAWCDPDGGRARVGRPDPGDGRRRPYSNDRIHPRDIGEAARLVSGMGESERNQTDARYRAARHAARVVRCAMS
jgi:hypothetical protein